MTWEQLENLAEELDSMRRYAYGADVDVPEVSRKRLSGRNLNDWANS